MYFLTLQLSILTLLSVLKVAQSFTKRTWEVLHYHSQKGIEVKEISVFFVDNKNVRVMEKIKNKEYLSMVEKQLNIVYDLENDILYDYEPDHSTWSYIEFMIVSFTFPGHDQFIYNIPLQTEFPIINTNILIDGEVIRNQSHSIQSAKIYNKEMSEDITEQLQSFAGPYEDFYSDFPSISKNLGLILYNMNLEEWDFIEINGKIKNVKIDLRETNSIEWSPEFSLF